MTLLYPIAMPLGLLLDWLVDEDENGQYYDRMELSALVNIQHEARTNKQRPRLTKVIKYVRNKDRNWLDLKAEIMEKVKERADAIDVVSEEEAAVDQLAPPLHQREVDMVLGSLSMKTKLAMDVYTPLKHVYAVPDDLLLDQDTITTIYSHGYSRVPVYRRNLHDEDDIGAITGYLITRQLMLIDWAHNRPLSTLPSQRPTCVSPRLNLVDLLRLLQTKGPLLTFACARPDLANRALKQHKPIPVEAGLIGIITLVDIVESILQDRIYDESDIHNRNNAVATLHRWAALKLQSFVRRRRSMLRTGSSRRGNSLSHSTSPSEKVELRPDEGVTEQTPLLSPTDRSLPTDGSMV
jgi:Mg2+/Co2+ transporter CorC